MSEVSVYLLVNLDVLEAHATEISSALSSFFGIKNVQTRSSSLPVDRLLKETKSGGTNRFYVCIGPSTSSTSTLEAESMYPIITLQPSSDPKANALAIAKCCSLSSSALREKLRAYVFAMRQARLVQDSQARTRSGFYVNQITKCYDSNCQITGDQVALDGRLRGKVRDRYPGEKALALVTTDRQSGFDRMLAQVPFKGAVLNLTSAYWFEQTRHIIPNHIVSIPHPYVSIVRPCKPFPIEFVVRYVFTM